jgi:K(+)-stimulated pyrophosphate-energized sodium pump
VASIVGVMCVKIMGKSNPQSALMGGTYVAAGLTIIASFFIINQLGEDFVANDTTYKKLGIFWSLLAGILSGVGIGFISEYYTSSKFKPVKKLAENSQSGPAICITDGLAWGMKSVTLPAIFMVVAIMVSFMTAGFYGIAMAAFGMLATTGIIVSVDSYGPIADNAGGVAEMAQLPPEVREITDNLDAVGNTTAAIGKGFAIGSAAFAAVGLLAAYMIAAQIKMEDMALSDPKILCGLLLGGMFPYFFSSLLFKAVTDAAYKMIEEVRRQFKENPKILKGEDDPDTTSCVDIATKGAIQGMLIPGGLAIVLPVIIGLTLGKEALAGVLVGTIVSGVMLGITFANAGGAYDNAKKYIEEGHFGGKGSETHKATVVGDTVGDPMKDTVGPSINILLKLMAVISLVFAPLFV